MTIDEAKAQVREAMGDYDSEDDYVLLLGFWMQSGIVTVDQIREGFNDALSVSE